MTQKNFFAAMAIAFVGMIGFTSCTGEENDELVSHNVQSIDRPQPKPNDPVNTVDWVVNNHEDNSTIDGTAVRDNGSVKQTTYPQIKENISVEPKSMTVASIEGVTSLEGLVSNVSEGVADRDIENYTVTRHEISFTTAFGHTVKAPVTIKYMDGHAGVKLESAKLFNIEMADNGEQGGNHRYDVKFFVAYAYNEINTNRSYTLRDTLWTRAEVLVPVAAKVDHYDALNKNRQRVDLYSEVCEFDKVAVWSDGNQTVAGHYSITLPIEFKSLDPREMNVTAFGHKFVSGAGVNAGNAYNAGTEGNWTKFERVDNHTNNIGNGVSADAFSNSYSFRHGAATYKDNDITVEFGFENVTVAQNENKLEDATSDKADFEKKVYTNGIRTEYLSMPQSLSEVMSLYKEVVKIVVTGYEFRNGNVVVNDNNTVATVDFVTVYSDGTEKSERMSKSFARVLRCTSNWEAYVNNAQQHTHFLTGYDNPNEVAQTDGNWSWVNQTRNISSTADFSNTTFERNTWESIEANKISVTREGQTYNFSEISYNATCDYGNVVLTTSTEELDTYNYSNELTVVYGGNTKTSVAPGKVMVAKEIAVTPDFPTEWGAFKYAHCTVAQNENNTDWVYTWSFHFENGTLPVVVGKDANAAAIDTNLFSNDTNAAFNGAVYTNNQWINSIAEDKNDYMQWLDTNSQAKRRISKRNAAVWHWNNDVFSVFSNAFTFEKENGKKVVVKKNGEVFATYNVACK